MATNMRIGIQFKDTAASLDRKLDELLKKMKNNNITVGVDRAKIDQEFKKMQKQYENVIAQMNGGRSGSVKVKVDTESAEKELVGFRSEIKRLQSEFKNVKFTTDIDKNTGQMRGFTAEVEKQKGITEKLFYTRQQIGNSVGFTLDKTRETNRQQEITVKLLQQAYAENKKIDQSRKKQTQDLEHQIQLFKQQQQIQINNIKKNHEGLYNTNALNNYQRQLNNLNASSMPEFRRQSQNMATELKRIKTEATNATHSTMSFGEQIKEAGLKFGMWSAVTVTYYAAIRAIKDGLVTIKELDSAMLELRKVTDETDEVYRRFQETAFNVANQIGRTADEVITATAAFARMGFTMNQSLDLAEKALLLTNIGDGIESVDESTSSIISTLKGFKMEAQDAGRIIDVLNNISNNYAVNTDDLAEGIKTTSATLAQSNTTFEESIAILTSATETMQDANKASTGIVTISQRLRSLNAEGESLGNDFIPKLQKAFSEIANVDIMDENGLRSTYDILYDTAEVWDTLTQEQQQFLGEMAAGFFAPYVQKCA